MKKLQILKKDMGPGTADHTFVVLAYKDSAYLEKCIQSVLNQTLPAKVLIATSTPSNYISGLAAKYGLEVRVNTNTGSIGKDWNFGYSCADTPYVTIAHQDDEYLPYYSERCVQAAKKYRSSGPLIVFNPPVNYVNGKLVRISFKNIMRGLFILPFHFKPCFRSKFIKKSILRFSNSISCPGVFFVKENLGDFRFKEDLAYILDWKAWYDMSQMDGAFIYVPKALHTRTEHENSTTSLLGLEKIQQEEELVLSQIWKSRFMPKVITWMLRFAK